MLWQKIVDYALMDIGVAIAGEDTLERNSDVAHDYLKLLISAWSTDSLLVPSFKTHSHTVEENKSCFTLGDADSDIDLEGARILFVRNVRYKQKGTDDYGPVLFRAAWTQMQREQSVGEAVPSLWYWDNTYPESSLWFDSVLPVGDKFIVATKTTLTSDDFSLTDETGLPGEYERALRCCLAEELLTPFSVDEPRIIRQVMMKSEESMRSIRSMNLDDLNFEATNELSYKEM